jgi:hypothetical protein
MGSDRTGRTHQRSALYAAGDSVVIDFLRKKCLSVSTTRAIRTWDRGAERFRSLKDFEVHDVLEKELRVNGQD